MKIEIDKHSENECTWIMGESSRQLKRNFLSSSNCVYTHTQSELFSLQNILNQTRLVNVHVCMYTNLRGCLMNQLN